jgi:hypothetical protein
MGVLSDGYPDFPSRADDLSPEDAQAVIMLKPRRASSNNLRRKLNRLGNIRVILPYRWNELFVKYLVTIGSYLANFRKRLMNPYYVQVKSQGLKTK